MSLCGVEWTCMCDLLACSSDQAGLGRLRGAMIGTLHLGFAKESPFLSLVMKN